MFKLRATLSGFVMLFLGACVQGCKKPDNDINRLISSCALPPAPVGLVLLSKQGTNLVTSTTDEVIVSYSDKGQTQRLPCIIGALQDVAPRQPSTKYGGLAVFCELGSISNRKNNSPVKTFQLTINNQPAGTIFFDLRDDPNRTSTGLQNCYKVFAFQFNNAPVQTDDTVMPGVGLINCNL